MMDTETRKRMGETFVTLFADASFCPKTKVFGYCFWIKHGYPAKITIESYGGVNCESCNEAEYEALKAGIAHLERVRPFDGKVLVVQSDSTYALDKIKKDLRRMEKLGFIRAYGKHVKGHMGRATTRNAVNTTCDKRAYQEMSIRRALVI